jgi:hypothetical protein
VLTFAQTPRGKNPPPRGEPPARPVRRPLHWGGRAENCAGLPTSLFTPPQKNPHKTTLRRALSTRFPQPRGGLGASGDPLAEPKERFAQQGNLAAQLTVVAHLSLDLGAGMNDGGVVTPAQGSANANERRVGFLA